MATSPTTRQIHLTLYLYGTAYIQFMTENELHKTAVLVTLARNVYRHQNSRRRPPPGTVRYMEELVRLDLTGRRNRTVEEVQASLRALEAQMRVLRSRLKNATVTTELRAELEGVKALADNERELLKLMKAGRHADDDAVTGSA